MSQPGLYPLRFEPIYQYRLWGGRRLADLLAAPLPDGPIGEAWILSDREDHPSQVANGPLKGQSIGQVMEQSQDQLMGKLAQRFRRSHCCLSSSTRMRCSPSRCIPGIRTQMLPPADGTAKTEAWVVLEAGKESRIYAGLKPGTTADILRQSVDERNIGRPSCIDRAEARRWRLHPGWDGSLSGRRRCGVRGSAEQRRDISPVRLGPRGCEDRQAAGTRKSIRRLPASISWMVQPGW